MKKKLQNVRLLGLVLAAAVLMAGGCGKKATPENLLSDMSKNCAEIKSASSNMKLAAEMGDNTDTMALNLDVDIVSTKKPEASHMEGKISFKFSGTDMGTDIEVYQVKEKDEVVSYLNVQNEWTKQITEAGENLLDEELYEELKEAYESFELKKDLVEVNDKKCFELSGKVDGGILSGIIDQDVLDSATSGMDLDADAIKDAKVPCVIDIYKESVLPAKIRVDMKDILTKIMGDKYEGFEVKDYYIEIVYNEYDKAEKIKVPKEAKEAEEAGNSSDWDDDGDDAGQAAAEPVKQSKELGENWDSYTVQIGEKVVTFPCSISDLEAAGLALDTEDTPEDTAVEADDYILVYFEDKKGNEIMVDLINTSGEPIKAADCLVGGISVDDFGLEEGGLDILFPGGITIGAAKEDVLAKYGEAADTYEGESMHMFTWADESSYDRLCEIDIDPGTNKVCEMSIRKYD